jgi:hypothetical protein
VNGFLWLGAVCTAILVISIVFDGFDDVLDGVDLGPPWLSISARATAREPGSNGGERSEGRSPPGDVAQSRSMRQR